MHYPNPQNVLRAPSVGSLVKEITEINPSLGVPEIIEIIRQASMSQAGIETVDNRRALELARATLATG